MPSACGSRSCLCQSVYPCGELFCRARRGGYHPPEAFPPVGGRWMAEGQTDEGFPRSHAWVPLAGRACPAGAPISSRRNGGKEGSGASPPEPPKRGLMAAVRCTNRAKTGSALPPAPLAGACGNWGPRRSPAKYPQGARRIRKAAKPPTAAQRVRWGEEFSGEAPPVADEASRKKGAARLAGRFGPVIALPRREQGSGGNELSGLPESERSVAWADDAAPRAARIAVTPQALRAAALYRVRPPGRHRCHAAEIPGRLRRRSSGEGVTK